MILTLEEIDALYMAKRLDEAIEALNERLAENELCADSLRERAGIYRIKKRFRESLADVTRLMAIIDQPRIYDHFLLAENNLSLGLYDIAEQGFRRVIRLCAEQGDFWLEKSAKMMLAIALLRMDRLDEAREIARALPEDYLAPDGYRLWQVHEILEYEPGMELPNVCPIFRPARGET